MGVPRNWVPDPLGNHNVTVQGTTTGLAAPTTPALMTELDHIMGQAVMTLAARGLPTTKCVLLAVATAIDLLTAIVKTVAAFAVVSYTSHASHLFPCLDRI